MSVAERHDETANREFPVTADFAQWVAGLEARDISAQAFAWARHALLDWFGVTIAGADEPLVRMLVEELAGPESADCTVVGCGRRASLHDAALINGAASHALDYDDVNRRLHGHPTVCVAPVALGLGELAGASGREVLASFIAGTEVACALGEMCDEGHYEAGYHATGTIGTFGAAAAAAKLMGLDASTTARALGIAASQAAGLKCNFGTMTKPLHAGKAAMNGLLAARLAARGFTARQDAIEARKGFVDAQAPGFDGGPIRPRPEAPLAVEQTLFKYHAACYLTHSALEAIGELRRQHGIGLDDVASVTLHIRPTHFSACCIPAPRTGLEIKFSIAHLAVLALDGVDTGALASYSDANANDARYVAARDRVRLDAKQDIDRLAGAVSIELSDGRTLAAEADVGVPAPDLEAQWRKLTAKFEALSRPVIGEARTGALIETIAALDRQPDLGTLLEHGR